MRIVGPDTLTESLLHPRHSLPTGLVHCIRST
jgi:hypothetical protein